MNEATRLATAAGSKDPATGHRAVAAPRRLLEKLEALQVGNARTQGWSWQEIAGYLGNSKQSVHTPTYFTRWNQIRCYGGERLRVWDPGHASVAGL